MVASGEALGWLVLLFFGLGIPVAGWQVVLPDRLVIDSDQIEVTRFAPRTDYRLDKCGDFGVWHNPMGRQQLVVFDYEGKVSTLGSRSNRWTGANSALPDTYGFAAADLAALLNDARDAASQRNS